LEVLTNQQARGKEPNNDHYRSRFPPRFSAFVDTKTGELEERRLLHPGEAEAFYRALLSQGKTLLVGMEARGHGRWFERLMGELHIEKQRSRATNGNSRRAIRRLPLRLIEQCVEKTTDQTTAEFVTYSPVRRQAC
jgi:hypothetical protein